MVSSLRRRGDEERRRRGWITYLAELAILGSNHMAFPLLQHYSKYIVHQRPFFDPKKKCKKVNVNGDPCRTCVWVLIVKYLSNEMTLYWLSESHCREGADFFIEVEAMI